MFQNPQDLQNLKLSLKFNFEEDFIEKNGKTSATIERAGTVCIKKIKVVWTLFLWSRLFYVPIMLYFESYKKYEMNCKLWILKSCCAVQKGWLVNSWSHNNSCEKKKYLVASTYRLVFFVFLSSLILEHSS